MISTSTEETHAEAAVERIMTDILSGSLPPGHKLRIEQIKQRYGIGASPLREALARLTSLGFVTNETRRGFRVVTMSQEDLEDITRLRRLVELELLREAISEGDDEWEVRIVSSFARLSRTVARAKADKTNFISAIEPAHKLFHTALVGHTRSRRLLDLQGLLYDQASRYRFKMLHQIDNLDEFLETHERLMRTILNRDATAAAALADHIEITPRMVFES